MMKKIFALLVLLGISLTVSAQDTVGTWSILPKVGVSIAKLRGGDADGMNPNGDYNVGLAAGVEVGYQILKPLELSAGLIYSKQGCDYPVDRDLYIDYLNIPVLANLYIAKGLALKAGGQLGINVHLSRRKNMLREDYLRRCDFSIPVGVSYELAHVVLDARYNWGLTEMHWSGAKNSVFQITLGYKFVL